MFFRIGGLFTERGYRYDLPGFIICQSDPGHFKVAIFHRIAANLFEHLLFICTTYDCLVGLAQGRIESGKLLDLRGVLFALGNIVRDAQYPKSSPCASYIGVLVVSNIPW